MSAIGLKFSFYFCKISFCFSIEGRRNFSSYCFSYLTKRGFRYLSFESSRLKISSRYWISFFRSSLSLSCFIFISSTDFLCFSCFFSLSIYSLSFFSSALLNSFCLILYISSYCYLFFHYMCSINSCESIEECWLWICLDRYLGSGLVISSVRIWML